MNFLHRWYYFWRTIPNYAAHLNRRVEVENILFAVAAGKRAAPSPQECRELAIHLGVPGHKLKERQLDT